MMPVPTARWRTGPWRTGRWWTGRWWTGRWWTVQWWREHTTARRMLAWSAVMVTYLTLWSAGPGWMGYWWAWLFVLAPVVFSAVNRSTAPQRAASGFVLPRVRFPTPHRRRRRAAR